MEGKTSRTGTIVRESEVGIFSSGALILEKRGPGMRIPNAFLAFWGCLVLFLGNIWAYELEKSLLAPRGEFFLQRQEQARLITTLFCTERPGPAVDGWLRTELYKLSPGAPRPDVASLRKEARKLILSLGGKVLYEGRCKSLAPFGDPRARSVVLTGVLPWSWGQVVVEVWAWEEGEDLYFRLTSMSPWDELSE